MLQAIARSARIGQKKHVLVDMFYLEKTMEYWVLSLACRKNHSDTCLLEGKLMKQSAVFTPENVRMLYACFFPAREVDLHLKEGSVIMDMFGAVGTINSVMNRTLDASEIDPDAEIMLITEEQKTRAQALINKKVKEAHKVMRYRKDEEGDMDTLTNPLAQDEEKDGVEIDFVDTVVKKAKKAPKASPKGTKRALDEDVVATTTTKKAKRTPPKPPVDQEMEEAEDSEEEPNEVVQSIRAAIMNKPAPTTTMSKPIVMPPPTQAPSPVFQVQGQKRKRGIEDDDSDVVPPPLSTPQMPGRPLAQQQVSQEQLEAQQSREDLDELLLEDTRPTKKGHVEELTLMVKQMREEQAEKDRKHEEEKKALMEKQEAMMKQMQDQQKAFMAMMQELIAKQQAAK